MSQSDKKSPAYAELLLREAYDVSLGIFDHIQQSVIDKNSKNPDNKRPLSLVALHPAEDTYRQFNYKTLAKLFNDLKIGDKFNISFIDFLNLPPHINKELIEVAQDIQSKESSVLKDLNLN